ncbi:hypothetical protein Tco_1392313 [Tanacetum coccineum]
MCLLEISQSRASDLESKSGGSSTGVHGLFSGRYSGLAGKMFTLRVSTTGAKGVTTGTLVPRCMAWLDYDEHVDSLSMMDNEAGVISPESTTQTLPSFEEYTPPVTYPEEVEKTLGTPIEVEPLNETKLKKVGLNCNHNTPLSSREVPSFDGPEPQPLLNSPSLDMFDDDWRLESKEVYPLREELSLFDRPNEVERGRILEAHRLEPKIQQPISQRVTPSHNNGKKAHLLEDKQIPSVGVFLALGWYLEEIHATWAHLEKKWTRLRTCAKIYQKVLFLEREDGVVSKKQRHRDLSGDGVWILVTASQRT